MAIEAPSTFADLRILSEWFARAGLSGNRTVQTQRLRRLGATAVPLLGRELQHADPARRDAARTALALLATTAARARVIHELRAVTSGAAADEAKVSALGLLAELGERGEATFSDPSAMQRRSALALAAQLETAADVAGAVDFMVRDDQGYRDDDDIVEMMQVLVDATPAVAQLLAAEVAARLDIAYELRERIADLVALAQLPAPPASEPIRRARTAQVALLVDAAARVVVVASRKIAGERRWRRWAVLIGPSGRIDDCLHEDDANDDAAGLIANLITDGYRVDRGSRPGNTHDHARAVVAAAARITGDGLGAAYYLGRDLLDLGDAHLDGRRRRTHGDAGTATIARAIELLGDHEPARAQTLLDALAVERTDADAAAARAACLAARGQWQLAAAQLANAIEAEPDWPLHHWNLAVARHQLGDLAAVREALVRFVTTSAQPTGLRGDPDQPTRLACAEKLIAELERTSGLARPPTRRRRRPRR